MLFACVVTPHFVMWHKSKNSRISAGDCFACYDKIHNQQVLFNARYYIDLLSYIIYIYMTKENPVVATVSS